MAKIISEKKQRRIWRKEANELAGGDIAKMKTEYKLRIRGLQTEYKIRIRGLQFFFWLSFVVNFVLAFCWYVK